MTGAGMPARDYLGVLASTAGRLLAAGTPAGYPASLAASVRMSVGRLDGEDPSGGGLVRLCALLGPEPVPVWLFTAATTVQLSRQCR
jgi:hypothetical protein